VPTSGNVTLRSAASEAVLSQVTSDRLCEGLLAGVIDIQDAVLTHKGVGLLLMVRHPGREGRDVPVQVCVALLAAQAEQIHPLCGHSSSNGPRHPVHHALQCQILRFAQLMDPALDVPLGRNQAVAPQGRVAGQEGDRVAVVIDVVMTVVRVPGQDCADEAGAFTRSSRILLVVKRHSGRLRLIHLRIISRFNDFSCLLCSVAGFDSGILGHVQGALRLTSRRLVGGTMSSMPRRECSQACRTDVQRSCSSAVLPALARPVSRRPCWDRLRTEQRRILSGSCVHPGSTPFAPLISAFRYADPPAGQVLDALTGAVEMRRSRLFELLRRTVTGLARRAPTVVVVEDVH
jgi:hypothetical protein